MGQLQQLLPQMAEVLVMLARLVVKLALWLEKLAWHMLVERLVRVAGQMYMLQWLGLEQEDPFPLKG